MKNAIPGVIGLYLILLIFLSLASCGGGGGGGSSFYQPPAGTAPPSISNLFLSPISALHNEGGGWIEIDISVDFVDQDGDVNYMHYTVLDSSGSMLYVSGVDLAHLVGDFSGTAQANIGFDTSTRGQFTIRVELLDETFQGSNYLEAQFSVI